MSYQPSVPLKTGNGKPHAHPSMPDDALNIVDSSGNPLPDFQPSNVMNLPAPLDEEETKKKPPTTEELWRRFVATQDDYGYMTDTLGTIIPMVWIGNRWKQLTEEELEYRIQTFLNGKKGRYSASAVKSCAKITPVMLKVLRKRHLKIDRSRTLIATRHGILEVVNGKVKVLEPTRDIYTPCYVDIGLPGDRIIAKTLNLRPIEDLEIGLFGRLVKSAFPDPNVRAAVREFWGDTLSPVQRKAMLILIGEPDSGKSQILEIVASMHDNAVAGDLDELTGFDIEHYIGSSLVVIDEIPRTLGKANETVFKRLVGGSMVMVKRKHRSAVSMKPTGKLIGGANQPFELSEKSEAILRRMRIIQAENAKTKIPRIAETIINGGTYTVHKNGEQIDKGEQASQMLDVLEWALHGAIAVQVRGDVLGPNDLGQASQDYNRVIAESSNPCITFIDETGLEPCPGELGHMVSKKEVYKNFVQWCLDNGFSGHAKVSNITFGKQYFARAMKLRFGDDWDAGMTRQCVDTDGTKPFCFPIKFKHLQGVKYVHAREAERTVMDPGSYERGEPKHVKNARKKTERDINKAIDENGYGVSEWGPGGKEIDLGIQTDNASDGND